MIGEPMELLPSMRALANYPHGTQPEESRPRGTCSISVQVSALRLRLRVHCGGCGCCWVGASPNACTCVWHTRALARAHCVLGKL